MKIIYISWQFFKSSIELPSLFYFVSLLSLLSLNLYIHNLTANELSEKKGHYQLIINQEYSHIDSFLNITSLNAYGKYFSYPDKLFKNNIVNHSSLLFLGEFRGLSVIASNSNYLEFHKAQIISGSWPKNKEISISQRLSQQKKIRIGDQIKLKLYDPDILTYDTFTVSSIFKTDKEFLKEKIFTNINSIWENSKIETEKPINSILLSFPQNSKLRSFIDEIKDNKNYEIIYSYNWFSRIHNFLAKFFQIINLFLIVSLVPLIITIYHTQQKYTQNKLSLINSYRLCGLSKLSGCSIIITEALISSITVSFLALIINSVVIFFLSFSFIFTNQFYKIELKLEYFPIITIFAFSTLLMILLKCKELANISKQELHSL